MGKTMVIMIAATMMLINGIASKTLIVGDANGWSLPTTSDFYQIWADEQDIVVGDILEFDFTTGLHTVAIVTLKEAYDNCDTTLDSNPELITQGPLQQTLTSSGQFYFFCTIGSHCGSGLKFSVNVTATPADTPSLASAPESGTPADGPSPALALAPGPLADADGPAPALAPAPAPGPGTHANGPAPAFAPSGFL